MKKLKMSIISAAMLLLFIPLQMNAENENRTVLKTGISNVESNSIAIAETEAAEVEASNVQLARLEEINALDM